MATRWVKLHLPADIGDTEYAEMANAVWTILQVSNHRGSVEPDGETKPELLDSWWQESVDERKWS